MIGASSAPGATEAAARHYTVSGKPLESLPESLYIPPEALLVFLQNFEGPLDLLLYLIRKHDMDILDIPIASIAEQYAKYIGLMRELKLDLAGEYLVMAATLADIKSRMLLPRPPDPDSEEPEDPRAELIRRIQEYERYRDAAIKLDGLPRLERDLLAVAVALPDAGKRPRQQADVTLEEMLEALREVVHRNQVLQQYMVQGESLSVRERMSKIMDMVHNSGQHVEFTSFYDGSEKTAGVVVVILAVLELMREALVDVTQNEPYAMIYVKSE